MKTTNGERLSKVIEELRVLETHNNNIKEKFYIDGSTSMQIGNDGKVVEVEYTMIYVTLREGNNEIKLPNYGFVGTLVTMIEKAAEILLWEHGMEV